MGEINKDPARLPKIEIIDAFGMEGEKSELLLDNLLLKSSKDKAVLIHEVRKLYWACQEFLNLKPGKRCE